MNAWLKLIQSVEKSPRLLIGLMSGTSADGTDAVLVQISGEGNTTIAELLAFTYHPFPPGIREWVLQVSQNQVKSEAISQLSVELAYLYSLAVVDLLQKAQVSADQVVAIGCHGQTISHGPSGPFPATLQIGEPAALAARTGIPIVSNFRSADVAAGGQGAPLVPFADWRLLTHPERNRVVQNIGGIANLTYLPAGATADQVLGFDTGPGNMLIDLATQWATDGNATYDADGHLAAAGRVLPELMEWLIAHPFLERTPPKSAGREEFGAAYWQKIEEHVTQHDLGGHSGNEERDAWTYSPTAMRFYRKPAPGDIVATLTAFTVYTIADAYVRFLPALPDEVIVSGGGARNPVLMQYLTEKLAPIPVLTSETLGINPDAREALAFALLADETLQGRPANLPKVTGAERPVLLGSITLPG